MMWSTILLGTVCLIALIFFYQRWMPVFGVKCAPLPKQPLPDNTVVLDIRDYQDADRFPVKDAHTLPYPYLKRHIQTIDANQIFVVAPDKVSRNLSIRLLQKHGRIVTGFAVVSGDETSKTAVKVDCS
ncbi:hypothetical protein [Salibacterium salarium]|nr:hypothetical protein [Salibacterium salarium]